MMKKSLYFTLALLIAVIMAISVTGFTAYAIPDTYTLTLTNAELIEVTRGEDVLTPESLSNGEGGYLIQANDSVKIKATVALGKDKEYVVKYGSSVVLSGSYDYSEFPMDNATFTFLMTSSYATSVALSLTMDQQNITKIGQFSVSGGKIQSIKRYDPTVSEGDKWRELAINPDATTYSSLYRSDRVIIKINDVLAENKVYTAKSKTDKVEGIFNDEEKTFSFTVEEFSGSYALVIAQEYYEIRINLLEDENSSVLMSAGNLAGVEPKEDEKGKYFTAKYNDKVIYYLNSKTDGYHIDDFKINLLSVKSQSGFKNNVYEKIEVKEGSVYKSASYEIANLTVQNKGDEIGIDLSSKINNYSVVYKIWSDTEEGWVTAESGDLTVEHNKSAIAPMDKGTKEHYYFVEWKEGKDTIPLTSLENINRNHIIYASYAKVKYTLSIFVGENTEGEVLSYEHGTNVEIDIQTKYGTNFIYTLDEEKTTLDSLAFDLKTIRFIMPTSDISIYLDANPAHNVTVTINGMNKEYSCSRRFMDGAPAEIYLPAGYSYSMESSEGHNTIEFSKITNSILLDIMPSNEVKITMKATPIKISGEVDSEEYEISYELSGEDVEYYGSDKVKIEYKKLIDKDIDESSLLNGLKAQFPALAGAKYLTMDLSLKIVSQTGESTASVKSGGAVYLIVKIDNDFIRENIKVYNYSQGGFNELTCNTIEKDGETFLYIKTDHFSPFVIASYDTVIDNSGLRVGTYIGLGFGILLLAAVIFIFCVSVKNMKNAQNTK